MDTPVIFIIFNRPACTERTFEAIRQTRPTQLFVIADGPRANRPGEREICQATRAVVECIDWPCEVTRDYSETNLGCGRRVSSGITRAFEKFEAAIILEDDCLPDPSFFHYCSGLLERYRNDPKVMAIIGDNLQGGKQWTPYSYFFSKYFHAWGWATWRRAWAHYDFRMSAWPEFAASVRYEQICPDPLERAHWRRLFDDVISGRLDTWDYQWLFTCWLNDSLVACPRVNLVSNIGFGPEAAHCKWTDCPDANIPSRPLGDLVHPPFVTRSEEADRYSFEYVHGGRRLREEAWRRSIPGRVLEFPRRLAGSVARRLGIKK